MVKELSIKEVTLDIKEVYGDRVVLKKIEMKKRSLSDNNLLQNVTLPHVETVEHGIVVLLPNLDRHSDKKDDGCNCYSKMLKQGSLVVYDRFATHQKHTFMDNEYIIIESKYVLYKLEN